jgi:RNA polymerase sigma factor (sigma-70 family)
MREFKTTRWSIVLAARVQDDVQAHDALAKLCEIYRPAVHAYVRRLCANTSDAEDLTQSFFERLLAKRLDQFADPLRGRFRVFLRTAVTHFLRDQHAHATALRRTAVDSANDALVDPLTPDEVFDAAWAKTIIQRAYKNLANETAQQGKADLFNALKPFLAETAGKKDYDAVAEKLSMRSNTIAVGVHRLRTRLREIVQAQILDTISNAADLADELRVMRINKEEHVSSG